MTIVGIVELAQFAVLVAVVTCLLLVASLCFATVFDGLALNRKARRSILLGTLWVTVLVVLASYAAKLPI